jgi:hypothetical protein
VIRTFIREDPAFGNILKWILFSVFSGTAVLNFVTYDAVERGGDGFTDAALLWYVGLVWLMVTNYVVFGQVRTRCSPFGMSLPIRSRSLWTAHMVAVATGGLLLIAVYILVAIVGSRLLTRTSDIPVFAAGDALSATAHVGSLYLLGVVLLDLRGPGDHTFRQDKRSAAVALVVAAVMLAVALGMMSLPPFVALLPLIAAAALGVRRYQALPESFSLTPDRAGAAVASLEGIRSWAPRERSRLSSWWLVATIVYRTIINKKASPFITIPFVLFFGMFLSGLDEVWFDEYLRPIAAPMAAYILMAVVMDPFLHFFRIEAYPISRRRVFALLMVPCLALLAVGYGVGRLMIETGLAGDTKEAICFCQAKEGYYYTHVPIEFCDVQWGGDVPENESPWGESHETWSTPLHKGSFIKLYSPFSVGEGASVDFAALQISRATQRIFGEAITPEEIKRRYLRERTDGSAALAADTLMIQRDFPDLKPRHIGPVFPILFMGVALLWFAAVRVFLGVMRAGNSKRKRMTVGFLMMAALFAIYIVVIVFAMTGFMKVWASIGFVEILARQMGDAFPGSAVLVWGVCMAIIVAAYRWVEGGFLRVEAVPDREPASPAS